MMRRTPTSTQFEFSRRDFLLITSAAMIAAQLSEAAEEVPASFDHIILGCSNLERGIRFIEERSGVRAVFGGVHPGRGTQNALLSLGEKRYLEILAPDPHQNGPTWHEGIKTLAEPRLVGWAWHTTDIDSVAIRLREAKAKFDGPTPGSRKRPDGSVLRWKNINVADDRGGILPFFIEWSADSKHPSEDAPAGCKIERLEIVSADPAAVNAFLKTLNLGMQVAQGKRDQLLAKFVGPKGEFEVSS